MECGTVYTIGRSTDGHESAGDESAEDESVAEERATIYPLLLLIFLHCLSVLLVNAVKMVSSLFVSFTC